MTVVALLLLSVAGFFNFVESKPSPQSALLYLSQYGYLGSSHINLNSNSSGALIDENSFRKGIEEFQTFAGLEVTGVLDNETLETMTLPRCGVKDKVGNGHRAKRYVLQGSRWKVKNLSYRISKYPANLKRAAVDDTLQKAFDVWAGYTDLTFKPSSGSKVHIDIRFEKGEHGDGDPFDGPGGTLAHAYFPVYGGDAHFDASERWTIDSPYGTNLFQVAAHEFGHSLGLSHSDVRDALMAPFYRGYDPYFELHEDDIDGIQKLYGKKTKTSGSDDGDFDESKNTPKKAPAPPRVPTNSDSTLCKNPKVDAILSDAKGDTFIFKGDKYWKVLETDLAPGYPKLIQDYWSELPANIDAAFGYKNGKTYFFKGSKYWRYVGNKLDGDYPKDISEGFTGIPDNVDSAFVWSGNGKIYFFKGSKFWKFDPTSRPPVKSNYPKPISNWEGVPDNVDAAFQWNNGYTYFFKDSGYYRFNDVAFMVDKASPAFPRSSPYWWFGCKDAPSGTIGTDDSRGWLLNGESDQFRDMNGLNDETESYRSPPRH